MLNVKKITLASLAALSLAALPGCSTLGAKSEGGAQVAALSPVQIVNGTPITRIEVDRTVRVLLAQSGQTPPFAEEFLKQVETNALEQLVNATLLYQVAAKSDIPDLEKRVADQLAQSKARFANPAEFESALKFGMMTADDFALSTRREIVINSYIEKEFSPKVTVTDEEISQYYEVNKDRYFKKGESVKASHILVAVTEKSSLEEKEKAQKKALDLLNRVKAGESFEELAKAESACPSAARGGDLGFFARGQMVPPFEQAAFAMKPGETSELVASQYGYHIIKVVDKQQAGMVSLAEVKDKIRDYLKLNGIQKLVTEYVNELRSKAKMEKG